MTTIGLRQLLMLALAAGMIALGALGLGDILTPSPILAAVLLTTAVILAFESGRFSMSLSDEE